MAALDVAVAQQRYTRDTHAITHTIHTIIDTDRHTHTHVYYKTSGMADAATTDEQIITGQSRRREDRRRDGCGVKCRQPL